MITEPFVRNPYNYDMNAAGDESGLECTDPTLAQQQYKEESDINTIVKRFTLTGQLPQNVRMPEYADFTENLNFHDAMNAIVAAREAFDQMPADVRARFHNDPGEFVDFTNDRNNLAEARKLGLVPAEELAPIPTLQATAAEPQGGAKAPGAEK